MSQSLKNLGFTPSHLIPFALAIISFVSLAACGSLATTSVPQCRESAHAHCEQTAEGYWVPYAYWLMLYQQQAITTGAAPAYRSSIPSAVAPTSPGVAEDEIEDAPSTPATPATPSPSGSPGVSGNSGSSEVSEDDEASSEDESASEDDDTAGESDEASAEADDEMSDDSSDSSDSGDDEP